MIQSNAERDLLADVSEALGGDEMARAADVAERLRRLAPGYKPYQGLTGVGLVRLLKKFDVEVRTLRGDLMVRRNRVDAALSRRAEQVDAQVRR